MININFVNDSINLQTEEIFRPFESFMESCKKDIDNMCYDFNIVEERVALESSIMGEVPEQMNIFYEAEKKNIFARIGETVVAIYNKFVDLVNKIIEGIKGIGFKKKSTLQKLDIFVKEHPDLKDEAIAAFNKGALDLSDVKNLKELDSTFEEIIKMSNKQDIDPDSLKGKWEKAKKKFEDNADKIATAGKVAGAAASVITLAIAIKKLPGEFTELENRARESKEKANEKKAEIMAELDKAGMTNENTGKWTLTLQIWREWNNMHAKVLRSQHEETMSLLDKAAAFVDKHTKKSENGGDLRTNLKHINDQKKAAEEKEINDIKAKTKAQEEAKREDRDAHEREDRAYKLRNTTAETRARTTAQNRAAREDYRRHRDEELDKVYDTAREQNAARRNP